jgi:hypothetical protein
MNRLELTKLPLITIITTARENPMKTKTMMAQMKAGLQRQI